MMRITPGVVVVGILMLLATIFDWTICVIALLARIIAFLCLTAFYLFLPFAAVVVLLHGIGLLHLR